jgi:hypothetical protein
MPLHFSEIFAFTCIFVDQIFPSRSQTVLDSDFVAYSPTSSVSFPACRVYDARRRTEFGTMMQGEGTQILLHLLICAQSNKVDFGRSRQLP